MSAARLDGKVVFVTGGGRGLGAAICRACAQDGARVAVADLDLARAQALAAEVGGCAIRVDVGDEDQCERALAETLERLGRLDALVNNAGVDYTLSLAELSVEQWDRVIRTNLRGPFLLAKFALPLLRKAQGDIVNVASTAAKRGWPNASAYHASKWGLLGLSYALHAEFREHKVRITAVIAGGMRTPFLLDRFPDLDPSKLQDPRDVARAVRFALTQPRDSVVAEITVLPVQETSWP